MNALLLPGNSTRHAEWIEKLGDALSSHFENTITQHYQHWQTDDEKADVEHEINVASKNMAELSPYIIVGKSIGTVIATKGIADNLLHPEKIILLGVPINGGVTSELFAQWLRQITIPIVIIQNTSDPLGSFADVNSAFEGIGSNIVFVELVGSTHDYLDFEAITSLI